MPLIIDQIPVKHSKTSGKVFPHRKRRIFFYMQRIQRRNQEAKELSE